MKYYACHPHFQKVCLKERADAGDGYESTPLIVAISVESAGLYLLQTHNREDCVRHEALRNLRDRSWGSLICLIALCEVLGISITSYYPNTSLKYTESVMNVQVYPRIIIPQMPHTNPTTSFQYVLLIKVKSLNDHRRRLNLRKLTMRKTQVMNLSRGKEVLSNSLTKTQSQRYAKKGKIKKS